MQTKEPHTVITNIHDRVMVVNGPLFCIVLEGWNERRFSEITIPVRLNHPDQSYFLKFF